MRQRLTIYMLQGVAKAKDAIDGSASYGSSPLSHGLKGKFFFKARKPAAPAWTKFVNNYVASMPVDLASASSSGLMVVKVKSTWFAITFGYGRTLLNPERIVSRFGLKIVLNRVDPSQLRSMDSKKFEDIAVTTSAQASRSASLPIFGLDVTSDILRAVTGDARDNRLGSRISGADPIVLTIDTATHGLLELLKELKRAYSEKTYLDDFEWVDNLSMVRDAATVGALNDQMVDALRVLDTSRTYMAMPDALDWGEIDAFRISPTRGVTYDDLDLDEYLSQMGVAVARSMTIDSLKQRGVSISFNRSADDWSKQWNVFKCLISEQELAGRHYVLLEGSWFEFSASIKQRVDAFVDSIDVASIKLIKNKPGRSEPLYNAALAKHSPDLLLLDAKIPRPGGSPSGVEFCDVLSADRHIVHVKRKARSSTLSHLFAQGSVSGRTFIEDGEYRRQLREKISAMNLADEARWLDLIPDEMTVPDAARYTVTYVVIADGSTQASKWLPFFSKLNLMQHGRQVRNMGYRLEIANVTQKKK